MPRRILRALGVVGFTVSVVLWWVSLLGVHWGRPGVLSVYVLNGMIRADDIAFTNAGWNRVPNSIRWSSIRFWPDGSVWTHHPDPTQYLWQLNLPLWIPAALSMLMVAATWRRKSPAPGRCSSCGYDLTGNVSRICPECGTSCERPSGEVQNQ